MAAFTWHGTATPSDVVNAGPLALIEPLLDKLDINDIIDQHLPPDPQQEYSHGHVLSVLLAARLCRPTALVNIERWAEKSGADIFFNIPADKLNDDRLGRALDAFFEHRHSILGSVTARALQQTNLSLERLHFDPTQLILCGVYAASQPRTQLPRGQSLQGDAHLAPAHISHGYSTDRKALLFSQLAVVDDCGALPVFAHCLDGNRNGHPAIREMYTLVREHVGLPEEVLMISDRGTCSLEHIARLHGHNHQVLCAAQWQDYRAIYDAYADSLQWHEASYLSIEQRRRRQCHSTLPCEHYEIAVLKHTLIDPTNEQEIPARLIFAYSTADERQTQQRRQENNAKIQAGLEKLQAKMARGHPQSTYESIVRQIHTLLGKKDAARYFHWQLVPLTRAERDALPRPAKGHVRPSHRLEFEFDAAAAKADERYDGLSVLVTTAKKQHSGDTLFTQYKEQNYVESVHHQFKTPIAVTPVFLKSPRRVEALVCVLQIAVQAYQVLERLYRQAVQDDADQRDKRMTAERLLRTFNVYGLLIRHGRLGRVVCASRLCSRQKQILTHLHFPTPAQTLARTLHPEPSG